MEIGLARNFLLSNGIRPGKRFTNVQPPSDFLMARHFLRCRQELWLDSDRHIRKSSKNVLISTHGDVVKTLILHALGSHLNSIDKLEIDNASLSVLEREGNSLRVLLVNDSNSKVLDLMK
jgi:broad specificity phosphatase PhoE